MTPAFTPARIAELRALAEKATKLPYRQHLVDDTTIIAEDGTEIACTFPQGGIDDDVDFATDVEQKERDAAFLAAAANTLPAALDEIERLREALHYYADDHANPADGPWGLHSNDFGDRARRALKVGYSGSDTHNLRCLSRARRP